MTTSKLSAERARELFNYDPDTGALTWKALKRAGRPAGTLRPDGYRQISCGGQLYLGHRLVWLLHTGRWPAEFIDHINGLREDNRICNLRDVSRRSNQENMRAARSDCSAGLQGVSPKRGKFRSRIVVSGVELSLGSFDTPEPAHLAYLKAKRQLHAGCTI